MHARPNLALSSSQSLRHPAPAHHASLRKTKSSSISLKLFAQASRSPTSGPATTRRGQCCSASPDARSFLLATACTEAVTERTSSDVQRVFAPSAHVYIHPDASRSGARLPRAVFRAPTLHRVSDSAASLGLFRARLAQTAVRSFGLLVPPSPVGGGWNGKMEHGTLPAQWHCREVGLLNSGRSVGRSLSRSLHHRKRR
ncbi:hypothetical protein OH77DRAFT_1418169 [Trametes cingulata]|nr:hypothetical protein OH77DRAFT_1418169 [Trametes cingulata]